MATDEQYAKIPDVESQTQLDEPVKVRWQGRARMRLFSSLHAALESDWYERAIAIRCLRRQKTQIVVKTEEELETLREELETFNDPSDWGVCGHSANGLNAIKRVLSELPGGDDEDEPVDTSIEVECDECDRTLAARGGDDSTRCICGNLIDL